ncbi:rhodanese-related sulfurtransferase [Candidatus Dependentiae bacterium]|nr:rhodanese-related sulfurtransferase [Candidatus Dependentiae bacterium]
MAKIVLYYKYIDIQNPEDIVSWQRDLCTTLNLKGRVLVAHEGINGTLGGSTQSMELYKKAMHAHTLFNDIDFKESPGSADHFPRLKVQVKKEIVRLGIDPALLSAKDAGEYLTPQQVHELINSNPENLVLLDTRNDYESRVGTFKDALVPNTKTFREFPAFVDSNAEALKDKQIVMFCTGGVRCERASAYVKLKQVAQKVYHIQGGIHNYVTQYPNGHFKGKNYVFDGRIANQVTNDVLAHCDHCQVQFDEYTNCINAECNRQIIVCPNCITSYHNTCSTRCLELVQSGSVNIRTLPHKITLESFSTL